MVRSQKFWLFFLFDGRSSYQTGLASIDKILHLKYHGKANCIFLMKNIETILNAKFFG
jgi:hypothetical protein